MFSYNMLGSFRNSRIRDLITKKLYLNRNSWRSSLVKFVVNAMSDYAVVQSKPTKVLYEELKSRSLVQVSGPDASSFLQGLITNDMRHFEEHGSAGPKPASMYSLLLNNQGRVLYDVIIYSTDARSEDLSAFLVECDTRVLTDMCKHLNIFKIRKKVEIASVTEHFKVWALFKPFETLDDMADPLDGPIATEPLNLPIESSEKVVIVSKDPRLAGLGLRLVLTAGTDPAGVICGAELLSPAVDFPRSDYTTRRYRFGVCEGISELPSGNCFPLECNAEYLHGVSFHKGCYIGQELTARTHHTGVVRKRVLPVLLDSPLGDGFSGDRSVKNERGKVVGRLWGHRGRYGVGLMRVQECLQSSQRLFVKGDHDDVEVKVHKPYWWPVEAPKENLAAKGSTTV